MLQSGLSSPSSAIDGILKASYGPSVTPCADWRWDVWQMVYAITDDSLTLVDEQARLSSADMASDASKRLS